MIFILRILCFLFRRNARRLHGCFFHYAFFSLPLFYRNVSSPLFASLRPMELWAAFALHPFALKKCNYVFTVYLTLLQVQILSFLPCMLLPPSTAASKCPIGLFWQTLICYRQGMPSISFPIACPQPLPWYHRGKGVPRWYCTCSGSFLCIVRGIISPRSPALQHRTSHTFPS